MPLSTEKGIIVLDYTDESPSRNHFDAIREIKESRRAFNVDIGLEGGRKNGHHWELLVGGSFGDLPVRFYGQLGYGRNLILSKNGHLQMRPVLNLGYGNFHFELGNMTQNGQYIQVNGQKFYSETVSVAAAINPFVFIPRVDIPFAIDKKRVLKFHIGYHLTLNAGYPFIRFQGEDENQESLTEGKKITENNVNLTINGQRVRKMPVELDGLIFGIGISLWY